MLTAFVFLMCLVIGLLLSDVSTLSICSREGSASYINLNYRKGVAQRIDDTVQPLEVKAVQPSIVQS